MNEWGTLQLILDGIDSIAEKIAFLQDLVSANEYVCYDGRCPIFSHIAGLRTLLEDLVVDSFAAIKVAGVSETRRTELEHEYRHARFECDKALQEVMRVATVNKALQSKESALHQRRIELIRELAKSNLPIPVNVKSDIEDVLNTRNGAGEWGQAKVKIQQKQSEGDKRAN